MKTKLKLALIYAIVAGFSLTLAVSCGNKKSPDIKAQEDSVATKPKTDTVKLVSSLEELYSYSPRYTVIEKCDLSHLGLKEIPAVWLYNIKKLDLSHNDLRFFDAYDFWKSMADKFVIFKEYTIKNLKPKKRKYHD